MRHHKSDTGTEHIIATETRTECGMTVYGSATVDTPATAARVADNLCERCREAMDDEMTLYEMADEIEG